MRPILKIAIVTSLLATFTVTSPAHAVSTVEVIDALVETLASRPQPRNEFLGTVMSELEKAGTITSAGSLLQNGDGTGPSVDICAYDAISTRPFCTDDGDLAGFSWHADFADMQSLALGGRTVVVLPEARMVNVAIDKWYLPTLRGDSQMVTIPDTAWIKVTYGNCEGAINVVRTVKGFSNEETGGLDVIERTDCASPQSAHVPRR